MAWGAQIEDKQQDGEERERLTPLSVLVGLAMAAVAAAGTRGYDSAAGHREARLARQAWIQRERGETAEAVSRAREALAKFREDQASRPTRSRSASTGRPDVRER